jgi:hypothetical protein
VREVACKPFLLISGVGFSSQVRSRLQIRPVSLDRIRKLLCTLGREVDGVVRFLLAMYRYIRYENPLAEGS